MIKTNIILNKYYRLVYIFYNILIFLYIQILN